MTLDSAPSNPVNACYTGMSELCQPFTRLTPRSLMTSMSTYTSSAMYNEPSSTNPSCTASQLFGVPALTGAAESQRMASPANASSTMAPASGACGAVTRSNQMLGRPFHCGSWYSRMSTSGTVTNPPSAIKSAMRCRETAQWPRVRRVIAASAGAAWTDETRKAAVAAAYPQSTSWVEVVSR